MRPLGQQPTFRHCQLCQTIQGSLVRAGAEGERGGLSTFYFTAQIQTGPVERGCKCQELDPWVYERALERTGFRGGTAAPAYRQAMKVGIRSNK